MNSLDLLKVIIKWKKQLKLIMIGSLLFSFIFTLPIFMPPEFEAVTIIYPVNVQSYSKETPTEQMVQLLESEDVRMKLADALDLYTHYEIDTSESFPRFTMMKRLGEHIDVSKTEFESIEISILDRDPQRASAMCDSLLAFADQKALSLVRERAQEQYRIHFTQMMLKKAELDSLENELKRIRINFGITDFENMVGGFSREYYKSMSAGRVQSKMEDTRKNLELHGGEYIFIKEMLWKVRGQYADYKLNCENAMVNMRKNLVFHNIIEKAVPPERKKYPKRSLIMLLFTLSTMSISMLVILYFEKFKPRIDQAINS